MEKASTNRPSIRWPRNELLSEVCPSPQKANNSYALGYADHIVFGLSNDETGLLLQGPCQREVSDFLYLSLRRPGHLLSSISSVNCCP